MQKNFTEARYCTRYHAAQHCFFLLRENVYGQLDHDDRALDHSPNGGTQETLCLLKTITRWCPDIGRAGLCYHFKVIWYPEQKCILKAKVRNKTFSLPKNAFALKLPLYMTKIWKISGYWTAQNLRITSDCDTIFSFT